MNHQLLDSNEILTGYDAVSALYPYIPSMSHWRAWEYAAYKRFSIAGRILDVGCGDGRYFKLIWPNADDVVGIDTADYLPAGTLVRCRQSIELRVGPGEYTFEIGLASISPEDYRERSRLTHEELFSRITRICHIPEVGAFSVGLRKFHEGAQLTHHGVADLPGDFTLTFTHA